jgi:hypothetical protein
LIKKISLEKKLDSIIHFANFFYQKKKSIKKDCISLFQRENLDRQIDRQIERQTDRKTERENLFLRLPLSQSIKRNLINDYSCKNLVIRAIIVVRNETDIFLPSEEKTKE